MEGLSDERSGVPHYRGVCPAERLFVAADCEILCRGQRIAGRPFIAARRGTAAACVAVENEYLPGLGYLGDLARQGKLSARAELEDRNGLAIVNAIVLCPTKLASAGAFVSGMHPDQLDSEGRAWWGAITVAAMGSSTRATLPAPVSGRPAGEGEPTTIELRGDIGSGKNAADRVLALMGNPERVNRTIVLNIDSNGGNFHDAMKIYRALAAWPRSVFANIKRAASGAAIIAMGADTRIITPDGTMFLHPVSARFDDGESYNSRQLLDLAKETLGHLKDLVDVVALGTDLDRETVEPWCTSETEFDAGTALSVGLVHAIRVADVPDDPRPLRARFAPINGPFAKAVAR